MVLGAQVTIVYMAHQLLCYAPVTPRILSQNPNVN